ncbi:MAG TPA: ABC transporter substrate-binding protein [Limnochordia bacterium]
MRELSGRIAGRAFRMLMVAAVVATSLTTTGGEAATRTVFVGGPMVGGQTLDGLLAAVEAFTERHPDVRVEMLQQSADAVKVAVAGGAPPDVAFVDGPLVSSWALAGIIQPLTPYITQDGVKESDFIPPSWRQNVWNGDVWAMPVIVDPNFALTYNVELFANAGLDPDAPPRTIPELESAIRRLTVRDAQGGLAQIGMVPWDVFGLTNTMYTWGWNFGGEFFDPQTATVTAHDPRNAEALSWLKRYYDEYQPMLGQLNGRVGPGRDRFMSGLEAMVFSHTGRARNIAQVAPDTPFGIAPMPYDPSAADGPQAWVGGWTLAIPRGAKNPDLGWEFIRFITADPVGTERFAVVSGWFTGYLRSPAYEVFREDPILAPFMQIVIAARHQRPVIPVQERYWTELEQAVNRVFVENALPREVLQHVSEVVQDELERALSR